MDLKEAYATTNVTEEEIASIQRYLSFSHTCINIISDFMPETYMKLEKEGWLMPETVEDLQRHIRDFVNIYSAMYKESKKNTKPLRLVRGTSNKRVYSEKNQFLSTSTDIGIAKTFSEYGDGAIVYINADEDVPFLDPTQYTSEYARDEHEIILAPFCRSTVRLQSPALETNGFSYYQATIEKPEFEEKTQEELQALQEEITNRFPKNLEDIRKLPEIKRKLERLEIAYEYETDEKELRYISKMKKQTLRQLDDLKDRAYDFNNKLQILLKGMCRQKEIEIDKAQEIVNADIARQKEEKEKQEMENTRKKLFSELISQIAQNPKNTTSLQSSILSTYEAFFDDEKKAETIAKKFGFLCDEKIDNTFIPKLIETIDQNLTVIEERLDNADITESITLDDVKKYSEELTPLLESVSAGKDIVEGFNELKDVHRRQLNDEVKRKLYIKVQRVIRNARVQKYTEDKQSLQNEHIGFIGRIFGKDKLKDERLKNLELKIQMAKVASPQTQEKYSVRSMLADMHICADTELDGNFSEEMQTLYNLIKSTYKDKGKGEFTEEYIKSLANYKIREQQKQSSRLPAVQNKKIRFFGKTKAQIEALKAENEDMKGQLSENNETKSTWVIPDQSEQSAVSLLEKKLRKIATITKTKEQENKRPIIEDLSI